LCIRQRIIPDHEIAGLPFAAVLEQNARTPLNGLLEHATQEKFSGIPTISSMRFGLM
jgi:hypothetical protein